MKKKLYLFWWKQNLQRPMPINCPLSVAGRNYLDPPPPRHHRYSKAKAGTKRKWGKESQSDEKHRDLKVQVESLLMHYSDSC